MRRRPLCRLMCGTACMSALGALWHCVADGPPHGALTETGGPCHAEREAALLFFFYMGGLVILSGKLQCPLWAWRASSAWQPCITLYQQYTYEHTKSYTCTRTAGLLVQTLTCGGRTL